MIKSKIDNLAKIYNINLRNSTTATVAKKLESTGFNSGNDREWVNQIESIVLAEQLNVLKNEKLQASLEKASKCPLCGNEGEIVTLDRNRPAFFCPSHRVVNPLSMEQIEALNYNYTPTVSKKD